MGRFQLLEKEINKGISLDEKSNMMINGWSPNNVRRLIIGYDFAIVQYFVTGGKYNKLIEIVDFRRVAQKDIEQIQSEPQKYKSILLVLTAGRICSSVEEIVFCRHGYPEPLLKLDTDISKIVSSNTSLENRFVRLRHVSIIPMDVKAVAPLLQESKSSETLLLDILKEKGVPTITIAEPHKDDWWKGVSLRPKYYSMDSETLPKYFEKVKERFELKLREEKLDEVNEKRDKEVLMKSLPAINSVLRMSFQTFDKANEVFEKAPFLSKAEWANVLQYKNMCKGIRKELMKNEQMITAYRKIDFDKIIKVARQSDVPESDIENIIKFREIVFSDILNSEEEYKRESNKSGFLESIQILQKLAGNVFNNQVNIVYLAFVKYLTRNTTEYVEFFYNKLGEVLSGSEIIYTRSIIEFCNKNIEDGWAKKAMDKINAVEVLVEEYSIPKKYKNTQLILSALRTVN